MPGQDLFTLEPIATPSDEHVVPNFLGGKLMCRGMLDKRTNDRFGSGIDASLEKALRPFLTILDARGDRQRARPAPTIKGVRSTQGPKYDVEAGGKVVPRPHFRFEVNDTEFRFQGSAPTEALLKQHLTQWCYKKGISDGLIKQALETVTHTTSSAPELHFDLTLFDTDCYRAIAKMGCNLLALHDPALFLCDRLHPVRCWVLGTQSMLPPPVQVIKPLSSGARLGDFDHLVRVTVGSDGAVEGAVQLLGSIVFAVNLGMVEPGPARTMTYRVDQIGGTDTRDADLDLVLPQDSFVDAAARSYEEFRELALLQLRQLWATLEERQRSNTVSRLLSETMEELGLKPGDAWGPPEKALFAEVFASKYAEHFIRHQRTMARRDAGGDSGSSA